MYLQPHASITRKQVRIVNDDRRVDEEVDDGYHFRGDHEEAEQCHTLLEVTQVVHTNAPRDEAECWKQLDQYAQDQSHDGNRQHAQCLHVLLPFNLHAD